MNGAGGETQYGGQVAIVGVSGRFPEANSLEDFWAKLRDGVECASTFSEEELEIPEILRSHAGLIRRRPVIRDADLFDASLFGYSPREAELIDPQQRLFLECCWEALEQAGYDPSRFDGAIGVFGGAGISTYFLNNIFGNQEVLHSVGLFQALLGNDKDFFTTRVSYKLDLRGPSINVLTGCSTSLVAMHLACQSLLNGECDMALAGGANIAYPQKMGYVYKEGSVNSPDGCCRPFDARANGTIPGDGVGVLLLKCLQAAIDSGDRIDAIIRGSAINNDGSRKAGFAAPSIEGQAAVVSEALAVSGVSPEQIAYVESHGTGTPLGDPIEVSALKKAFKTERRNYCALGALKANIGHTDAAAGVMGVIKVVLAMKNNLIPPTLHFERPNPEIDFENSPFYVNTNLLEWRPGKVRRFAGVSSFGVGGTNAHAILEEPPAPVASSPAGRWQLLKLAAKSESALDTMSRNLAAFLRQEPDTNIADAAYTLHVGREAFGYRRIAVCRDAENGAEALESPRARSLGGAQEAAKRSVVFLFPGQGSQYGGMGRDLYEAYEKYREEFDRCITLLKPHLGLDLRDAIFDAAVAAGSGPLSETALTQPAVFVTEYALARLLMHWGLQPEAMLGHGIGEYVAACIAGVFSLEDALSLVALRGRLMQQQAPGAMIAVTANIAEVTPFITKDVVIAAINGENQIVLSGPSREMEHTAERLGGAGLAYRILPTSRAFHSPTLEPVLYPFTEAVRRVRLSPPRIPYISNLTGGWITAAQATDPLYWGRHIREAVLFSGAMQELLKQDGRIFLEVGPGKTLTGLGQMHVAGEHSARFVAAMRPINQQRDDCAALLEGLGRLWVQGASFGWPSVCAGERRSRISLPTYPFERRHYLIRPSGATHSQSMAHAESSVSRGSTVNGTGADGAVRKCEPRPKLRTAYQAATNELEEQLIVIWQDLFGVEPIGIHDDFFELGGHSLMASQLTSRLQATFPVKVSMRDLMTEGSTVANLATTVERFMLERLASLSEEETLTLLQSTNSREGVEN